MFAEDALLTRPADPAERGRTQRGGAVPARPPGRERRPRPEGRSRSQGRSRSGRTKGDPEGREGRAKGDPKGPDKGDKGDPGGPFVGDYPKIQAINWVHGVRMSPSQSSRLRHEGFLIAFTEFMNPATFNRFTFEIFARVPRNPDDETLKVGLNSPAWEWVGLRLVIQPLTVESRCGDPKVSVITDKPNPGEVNGVRLTPRNDGLPNGDLLIVARGDPDPGPEAGGERGRDRNTTGPGR